MLMARPSSTPEVADNATIESPDVRTERPAQQIMSSLNSKLPEAPPFRLLDLPIEIRLLIYHTLPVHNFKLEVVVDRQLFPINAQIILVCRQTNIEGTSVLYAQNELSIRSRNLALDWGGIYSLGARNLGFIRKLYIESGPGMWKLDMRNQLDGSELSCQTGILPEMTALDTITLCIRWLDYESSACSLDWLRNATQGSHTYGSSPLSGFGPKCCEWHQHCNKRLKMFARQTANVLMQRNSSLDKMVETRQEEEMAIRSGSLIHETMLVRSNGADS
jgi:hypothetical protein